MSKEKISTSKSLISGKIIDDKELVMEQLIGKEHF